MRNIEAQKTQGKEVIRKHPRADLTAGEMHQLWDTFQNTKRESCEGDALWDLISDVFYMGVAVGSRNAK